MKLRLAAYNGMMQPVGHGGYDEDEARTVAADYLLTARRRGHDVSTIHRGSSWEIQTQANIEGLYVSDEDGVLSIHSEPKDAEIEEDDGWWDDAA